MARINTRDFQNSYISLAHKIELFQGHFLQTGLSFRNAYLEYDLSMNVSCFWCLRFPGKHCVPCHLLFFMPDLEPLFIALLIFFSLYLAYFTFRNKFRGNKVYSILINCIATVLCLILIFDAIKKGSNAFIFILLLMMGISVKKLIDETKKRRHY